MERTRFISIRTKLLLGFLLLSLLPLTVIGITGSFNVKKIGIDMTRKVSYQLSEKAKNMLSNTAKTDAGKIELLVNQYRNDIQMLSHHATNKSLLAERIKNPDWINSQEKADLDAFYKEVQLSRPEMSNIRLFYKDGYAVSRLRNGDNTLIDSQTGKIDYKGDKIWFKRTMDKSRVPDGGIYVSAINVARNNNKPEIRYTVPVNIGGKREGLVIINYSATAITESLANSKVGNEGYVFLVDKQYETAEGKPIEGGFYLSHPQYKICNEDQPGTIVDINALQGESGYVKFSDNAQEWSAAYHKVHVQGREWYVIATIPTADMMQAVNTVSKGVFASVRKLDTGFVILVAVSMLFILVASIYLSSQITRPVERLTEIAEKISMGDTNVTVDIKTNDEIGLLAKAFDRMVSSIKILTDENLDKYA